MNVKVGLERTSAVLWGIVALWAMALGVGAFFALNNPLGLAAILAPAVAYGLHRVTVWLIAGFAAE